MHNSKYRYTVIKMYLLSQVQGSGLRSIYIFSKIHGLILSWSCKTWQDNEHDLPLNQSELDNDVIPLWSRRGKPLFFPHL